MTSDAVGVPVDSFVSTVWALVEEDSNLEYALPLRNSNVGLV